MVRRLKEADIKIIVDNAQFLEISNQVRELLAEVSQAIDRLEAAKKELVDARKEIDRATARLREAGRRPVIRNTPL